jgi:hypothetical protein
MLEVVLGQVLWRHHREFTEGLDGVDVLGSDAGLLEALSLNSNSAM